MVRVTTRDSGSLQDAVLSEIISQTTSFVYLLRDFQTHDRHDRHDKSHYGYGHASVIASANFEHNWRASTFQRYAPYAYDDFSFPALNSTCRKHVSHV
jgi:hypothetical protein